MLCYVIQVMKKQSSIVSSLIEPLCCTLFLINWLWHIDYKLHSDRVAGEPSLCG